MRQDQCSSQDKGEKDPQALFICAQPPLQEAVTSCSHYAAGSGAGELVLEQLFLWDEQVPGNRPA